MFNLFLMFTLDELQRYKKISIQILKILNYSNNSILLCNFVPSKKIETEKNENNIETQHPFNCISICIHIQFLFEQ